MRRCVRGTAWTWCWRCASWARGAAMAEREAMAKQFGRVAVLMGGPSAEREISLLSGNAVLPAHEGSTIGLTVVRARSDFGAAYALAASYDELVIAEEFIAGQELTASIVWDPERGEVALPLVRIEAPQGNYDYQNKYFTDATKYYCPASIRPELEDEIREVALKSFGVLG